MELRAHLWFGTTTYNICPIPYQDALFLAPSLCKRPIEGDGAELVYLYSESGKEDKYALAIKGFHLWVDSILFCAKLEIKTPTLEQCNTFLTLCEKLGWPCPVTELGWHLGAAYSSDEIKIRAKL
jgi:hypothetical protein